MNLVHLRRSSQRKPDDKDSHTVWVGGTTAAHEETTEIWGVPQTQGKDA